MKKTRALALIAAALSIPASYGATIYTNFDSSYDTIARNGEQAEGSNFTYNSPAYEFQATQTAQLTQIDIALTTLASFVTSDATLELFSAVSNSPFDTVGTEIGGPYAVDALPGGTVNPVVTATITGGPTLTAGSSYFLAVIPGAGSWLTWDQQNSPSLVSLYAKDVTGNGTYDSLGNVGPGGFDLIGDPVATPEPTTMALAGFALLSVGLFRKQRTA